MVVWCLQAQNFQEAKQQEFAQLKPSRDKQFQAEAYIQDRVLIDLLQKDRKWVLSPNMLRGYLWDQTIPVDGAQARCVMLSHSHYVLIDKILYHLELGNPYVWILWWIVKSCSWKHIVDHLVDILEMLRFTASSRDTTGGRE